MVFAPCGDLVIIVATGYRRASEEKQNFPQRTLDFGCLARIVNIAEMIEQQTKTVFDEHLLHDVGSKNESDAL